MATFQVFFGHMRLLGVTLEHRDLWDVSLPAGSSTAQGHLDARVMSQPPGLPPHSPAQRTTCPEV